jgi:superfamily II DNA or RNA helicase
MDIVTKYNIYIHDIYNDLINSKKDIDNYDLSKIFEYFSAIQLTKKYNQPFYEYNDIDPNFKEENKLTRTDTGIDLCDLNETIVQCKLRNKSLSWLEVGTFFGSQNIYDDNTHKTIIRWPKLIITRNKECVLSANLKEKQKLFTDITFSRDEIINYCDNLLKNPVKINKEKSKKFKLRDYQSEAIKTINDNDNSIICLPTGCGKNVIIIFSMNNKKRYLILVPRIILMDQFKDELIKHKPDLKNKIQTIGDNNNHYDKKKTITICVYNSVNLIEKYCDTFDKIFIDEAHHINNPEIYENEDDNNENDNNENNNNEDDNNEDDNNENDNNENDDNENDDNENDDNENDDNISIIKDDSEDEIKNTTGFNKIIKSLTKYKNNVYLSATIDNIDGFVYYKKDIRDMINSKYLSDYKIHIPIFSDDPTNKNICNHLIKNYRNIIIYCNSQKEGKKINELLNFIQKGSSNYIDCTTSKKQRNKIIDSYKEGKIAFLVNVRILVEGFDAPITKGVCFIHLPSSKTTIIQIIGRALRLHPLKTFANIILPFSSNDDESNINKFLHILANNDKRVKKSYENKVNGGYIAIEKIDCDNGNDNIEYRYEMIYNKMGIIINSVELWKKRLQIVKDYIDKYEKRPSRSNNDKNIKSLGIWLYRQIHNYKNKKDILKNREIRILWEEFIKNYNIYFLSNIEEFILKLEYVKKYINKNNKRPALHDKNREIKKYGVWLASITENYKNNEGIMKNENVKILWEKFINEYKKYFLSNIEEWKLNLLNTKKYIIENNKRPIANKKDKYVNKLGNWLADQISNYKNKLQIMSNPIIEKLWTEFINDILFKKYFISKEDEWKINLKKVEEYIIIHNKIPSKNNNNNINIKALGNWVSHQTYRYNKSMEIMKNEEIRKLWKEFIEKYKEYFI